ncbi:NUDIX hydrolase [Amycolatopsis azurea]|uniref:NUDIX domain-containing protein n=1 Tax=Amycolatopsis azurea DSM 43854 TaxID=1238180 RepID=M2QDD8_9PSEU|nr:NUDIX domain-containing protein [Amycolatopsis azurea]EMD24766.1 hypothetical protein C791_5786 [Amycolatopsis azurea DSM 43854]OOC08256.1 NUDIX domain-containing protein [Amycolatopsis azurea DSM 43854]
MAEKWVIPKVATSVDLVILTIREQRLHALVIERAEEPDRDKPALPGGFLATEEEDLDAAAARELAEETGLRPQGLHLEQLRTYGAPNRDPRLRVITTAYLAILPDLPEPVPGGDARAASWQPANRLLDKRNTMAFDHARILADGVERARGHLEHTTLAAAFCAPEFTVADLRAVYEAVWGHAPDPRNFHRKVTSVDDFLLPTGRRTTRHGGRPAALYRRGGATTLYPPILRESSATARA